MITTRRRVTESKLELSQASVSITQAGTGVTINVVSNTGWEVVTS